MREGGRERGREGRGRGWKKVNEKGEVKSNHLQNWMLSVVLHQ